MADLSSMMVAVNLGQQQNGRKNSLTDRLPQCLIHCYQPSDLLPAHECQHDRLQIADKAKFTLVPTTTPFATYASTLLSQITVQDNARPNTERVAMICLTACQMLPWLSRSPVHSPIEHMWDMMGRRLHLQGNVDDLIWTIAANLARNTTRDHQGALSLYVTSCGSLHLGLRYRTVACFVTGSSLVPLKTRRVGQRCTLNLSRAETFSRWCGVVVRRGGASSGVVHVT
ncbi:uncharacterized protein TNCV_2625821 [Trichonephila clavipes]|nr:uncharacterized protein TNCV_2625821 [Trichonephila clavipes]